jgi:fibronectin type 3 domain-containing protein
MAVCTTGLAQTPAAIAVRAHVKEDVIQLRWAPNTPTAWKQLNQYGYTVERFTIVRDGIMLSTPERIVLTPQPLKPQPLNNWQTLAISNNFAAVIAQALYGEDFTLSDQDSKGISRIMALAQELEQRYLLSLYAADLCYPAALLAGWGLEDNTVKAGERYLYKVIPAVPEKTLRIETGLVYISLKDVTALPQPQELTAVFQDKGVLLTWNYGIVSSIYNAYYLEKSLDGNTFQRLSDVPLVNMNSKNGQAAERMFYTDSLQDNSTTVFYRLIGVTAFGQESPPSDVVQGKGTSRLIYVPHINRAVPDDHGVLTVEWEFDERGNEQLAGFDLQRSDQANGPFTTVRKNIAPASRTVTYDSLSDSNYFVIAAVPKEGEPVLSFPVLVQPSDTIPPSVPVGLKGTVDTLGIVRLTWISNTERDLLGYRVYRAQTQGEELIPLTNDVRNLNSQVFYAITALDKRYNQSPPSQTITLEKPELVPPSSPVIIHYKVTQRAVELEWATGGEDNLGTVKLMRAERGKKPELLKAFTDVQVSAFKDSLVQPGKFYSYSLMSVTRAGTSSASSPVVTVQAPAASVNATGFSEFKAKYNRRAQQVELSWKHNTANVKQVEVYRSGEDKPMSLLRTLKGFESNTTDQNIKPGVEYEYVIRTVLENGRNGATAKTKIGVK